MEEGEDGIVAEPTPLNGTRILILFSHMVTPGGALNYIWLNS
jgi:hypothetical protein